MPISVETIIEDQQVNVTLEQEPVDIDISFKTEEGKFLTTLIIAHFLSSTISVSSLQIFR